MLLVKNASSQEDKQPTVQALAANHIRLLASLADALLVSKAPNLSAGLLVIRDELLALSTAIREVQSEEGSLEWVLAKLGQRLSG